MLLSIVTINFNHAEGLRKTVQSLATLRKNNLFQWVFIDGGSTDRSLQDAKHFSVPGDTLVSEHDRGIYHAMNKGIFHAGGEFILFLNSGDQLHPQIHSLHQLNLNVVNDLHLFGFQIRNKVRMPRMNTWRYWSMPTSHQAIIYSTQLLKKYPFNESYRLASDFEHYLRINKKKLKIQNQLFPLIINEPYGSDQNLSVVLREYQQALVENGYPALWASFVFWLKSLYLKYALKV